MKQEDGKSRELKQIASGFSEVIGIGSFGGFIYVADAQDGFYSIEAYKGDEFSLPRPINIKTEDDTTVMPTQMLVFALGGILNATLSLATMAALLATLTLF